MDTLNPPRMSVSFINQMENIIIRNLNNCMQKKNAKEMAEVMNNWNGKSYNESNLEFRTRNIDPLGPDVYSLCYFEPEWDWVKFDYRVKPDAERLKQEEIENNWNRKTGDESNIEFQYLDGDETVWYDKHNPLYFCWDDTIYRMKIDPEILRREEIEKAWNGKSGAECNIQWGKMIMMMCGLIIKQNHQNGIGDFVIIG